MKILRAALLTAICAGSSMLAQSVDVAKQIYQSANPSVFLIYLNDSAGKSVAFGSGFQIAQRTIATNAHVIAGGSAVVAFGPVRIPAKVSKLDNENDLAILTVDADLTSQPLSLAIVTASPGEQVFAIGNPEGLEKTISQGIVSGIRTIDGKSLLQITSPISHGSSGGPVLNSRGEVVGVAVGMLTDGQNLNFAVPVSYLRELIESKADRSNTALNPSTLAGQIADLMKETYSNETDSAYQTKMGAIRSAVESDALVARDAPNLNKVLCTVYSKAPDELADAVIVAGRRLLTLKGGASSEVHAVIAYDLAAQAIGASEGPEQAKLIAESRREGSLSLTLGKQGNATADYANGRILNLEKRYPEALGTLRRALAEDKGQYACGYDLTPTIYREAILAAKESGNYTESERLFGLLAANGYAYDFDWDEEGDRRADHGEYLAAAEAYQKSEDLLPVNACYSAYQFDRAVGDHNDSILAEGRKCFNAASKLTSAESIKKAGLLATVHGLMAEVLNSRGVYTEALSQAKDSVSLDTKHAFGFYQEAVSLEGLNRAQECISAAQQSVILTDGKFGAFDFQLGSCYFDAENWVAAGTSFRQAADKDKSNAGAAFNLGLSYKRQGYGADAKQWFQEALKRNPDAELKRKILSALE